jgi:uncharacterized protein (TIGR03000 family)
MNRERLSWLPFCLVAAIALSVESSALFADGGILFRHHRGCECSSGHDGVASDHGFGPGYVGYPFGFAYDPLYTVPLPYPVYPGYAPIPADYPHQPLAPPANDEWAQPRPIIREVLPSPKAIQSGVSLKVQAPSNATVWVNGVKGNQKNRNREFMSLGLDTGKVYTFEVRAQWMEPNGKSIDLTRHVAVRVGDRRVVDFNDAPANDASTVSNEAPR